MAYTQYYCGPGGASGNSGLTYALRKLTLSQVEAILVAATRATVNVAPGTYRETLTCAVSGPAPYVTGTVDVVAGSRVVTGHSTLWAANAQLNDYFQVLQFAHGTDGVTNGTSTFTSAAGNFQAGHVGMTIRIDTRVAGIIDTVTNATTITIKDTAGVAVSPSAGSGLTYDVGPSGPIKVASVDSDTQITLAANWDFPTLTGLAYQVWGHVEYVGDYLGNLTDGVGGVVRITGSDNDQAATRANCIIATSKNQRSFSGLQCDTTSAIVLSMLTSCSNWVISKSALAVFSSQAIVSSGTGTGVTVDACLVLGHPGNFPIQFINVAVLSNMGGMIQNCMVIGGLVGIETGRVGGITVRNCTFPAGRGNSGIIDIGNALTVGQAITVNNCVISYSSAAFVATVAGEIQEDYNSLSSVITNYTNTTTGAHTVTYPPLFDSRWFFQLLNAQNFAQVASPFDLSAASQLLNLTGRFPTLTDLRGTVKIGSNREYGALEYDSSLKVRSNMLPNG